MEQQVHLTKIKNILQNAQFFREKKLDILNLWNLLSIYGFKPRFLVQNKTDKL